jgi:branched-subunit amino acid ABC-type transport system permease component
MTQALLNGLVSALLIALPAIALSLTYGILNFANFSIGAMITTGAYLAYIANASLGMPIVVAAPAAAVALALVAIAIQHGVYRQIRNADHVTLLVASMGVAFVLENVLRFFYGADVRTLDVPVARPLIWNGLRLNHEQLTIAVVALSAMVVVAFILKRTRLGRAMRAISDDPDPRRGAWHWPRGHGGLDLGGLGRADGARRRFDCAGWCRRSHDGNELSGLGVRSCRDRRHR